MAALLAAWFWGWHFAAGELEKRVTELNSKLQDANQEWECTNQRIEGFPFRLGLFCDAIFYAGHTTGIAVESAAMRSAAQFYQPNKAVIEFDSPALVTLPVGDSLNAEWESLRASIDANLEGPQKVSIHGRSMKFRAQNPALESIGIPDFQLHLRQNPENAIDAALSVKDFTVGENSQIGGNTGFSLSALVNAKDIYSDLLSRKNLLQLAREKGLKGNINSFEFTPNEGGLLAVSGPLEISPGGRISGQFDISFIDLDKIVQSAGYFLPEFQPAVSGIAEAIKVVSAGNGGKKVSMRINARNGKLYVGIVPIGTVPPLY